MDMNIAMAVRGADLRRVNVIEPVVRRARNDNYFPAVTTIRNRHVFEGV